MQERRNSIANALELHISCVNPPICDIKSPATGLINILRPRYSGRYFANDTFKCSFLNENVSIPIKISHKFVPKGSISNIPALAQMIA